MYSQKRIGDQVARVSFGKNIYLLKFPFLFSAMDWCWQGPWLYDWSVLIISGIGLKQHCCWKIILYCTYMLVNCCCFNSFGIFVIFETCGLSLFSFCLLSLVHIISKKSLKLGGKNTFLAHLWHRLFSIIVRECVFLAVWSKSVQWSPESVLFASCILYFFWGNVLWWFKIFLCWPLKFLSCF